MAAVPKGHARGTHRMVSPATTLARIQPHLASFGITRCADITGLDCIGIPVYVAVRPQGRILQASNGKGLSHVDAQVSALMEAIEHWHAENPVAPVRRACRAALITEGRPVLSPRGLEGGPSKGRVDRMPFDWVEGVELVSGAAAWIPAYAAAYHRDRPFAFSYNGLASGNHPVEATLHALYEVIERDSLARLSVRGQLRFDRCGVVALDPPGALGDEVGDLVERIRRAELQLVLLHVPTAGDVHTLMAVLLDPSAFSGASMVNFGTGAHLSPTVAAIRAITEAAQSRLTFIHGSREDLTEHAYARGPNHEAMLAYFSALRSDTPWSSLADRASDGLHADLARVLATIPCAYAVDLGQGKAGVSAMKVIVPGARLADWI